MASSLLPCQSSGLRGTKIPKEVKMAADTEKELCKCLLCNNKIGVSTRNSINIFGDKAVTDSDKSVLSVLCSTLKIPIIKGNANSVICKKCFKLLNEVDELESKLAIAKQEVCNLYKKTLEKVSQTDKNGEEANDHNYVEDKDCKTTVTVPMKKVVKTDINVNVEKIPKHATDASKKLTAAVIVKSENILNEIDNNDDKEVQNPNLQKEDSLVNDLQNCDDNSNDVDASINNDADLHNNDIHNNDDSHNNNDSQNDDDDDEFQMTEVLIKEGSSQKEKKDTCESLAVKKDDGYVCAMCDDDDVKDHKNMIIHLKKEHDARLYICDICGDMFKKRTELSHHLDEHIAKEEGDFQCEVCNRIFNNLRLFRIHKRIHYPQVKSWSCNVCGKRYSSKNLLDEHMNTHTGHRPYICEVCGKDFASKYTYRSHAKTHEDRPRPFECTQCNKSFLSQQNLSQHIKTHNGVKEFICQTCGKAFGSAHNLDVHKIVHTGYKPYICHTCGKAFARKAEIRDHERTHTGEKPYQCELCGATFSQRSNLQSHKRATHFNDKRYKCDDCGKGFKRRRLLDYHIKAAHTGERPYKCETCSATFVYPEHFKKHMRIHTGEKPYSCEVCGKAFNSRDNRNAHRFIHSDKKPYECLVCGADFMRKPLLYAHMQSQGHLNDTIVVNQPRLTTQDQVVLQDNSVHIVVQNEDELDENTQLIVAELKDHVIIQNGDQQNVLSNDELNQLVANGQLSFENAGGMIECKTEAADTVEDVYGYQDEEGNTIVLPPGTDIKDLIENGSIPKTMQLVQIRIPTNADVEGRDWLNIVQST